MTRRSQIDIVHAGEDVISLAIMGQPHIQIARNISAKYNTKISRLAVMRYLERNKDRLVLNDEHKVRREIMFTLESVQETIKDTMEEVQRRLEEFQDDPRALVAFLRLKLEAVDRVAKIVGAYRPEVQLSQEINIENITPENVRIAYRLYPHALSLLSPVQKEQHEEYRKSVEQ